MLASSQSATRMLSSSRKASCAGLRRGRASNSLMHFDAQLTESEHRYLRDRKAMADRLAGSVRQRIPQAVDRSDYQPGGEDGK